MKVGDYVRTKNGYISKIICIEENFMEDNETFYATENQEWQGAYNGEYYGFTSRNDLILKSSPNIIDLIEAGDLVTLTSKYCENEVYRVIHIFKDNNDTIIELDCFKDGTMFISNSEDIKSIVTREQFEVIKYEIK